MKIKKLRKSEISKFKIVYKKLSTIDESPYRDWNRLIYLIKDCVNPTFNEDLNKFNEIINGIDCSTISLVFKMMHNTQFFKRYEHYNQIKFDKFIRSIRKECQEDDLLELSNKLAGCFGHVNDDYNECVSFLKNVILHFNTICYVKEMKINLFTERVWKKSN